MFTSLVLPKIYSQKTLVISFPIAGVHIRPLKILWHSNRVGSSSQKTFLMKKLILIATIFSFSYALQAQNNSTTTKSTSEKMEDMHDCVIMKDGKMWVMKDGKTMSMDKEMTMENGTVVMADGHYMNKGGEKMMLKNGQCINMDGKMMMADKDMGMDMDMHNCVMMKDGKMMMMKDGKMMSMDKDMTMKNGTMVMTDGHYMTKGGEKMMMKDGQCIDMSGKMKMDDDDMKK